MILKSKLIKVSIPKKSKRKILFDYILISMPSKQHCEQKWLVMNHKRSPQFIGAKTCWELLLPLNSTPGCINTYLTKSGLNLIDIGI